MKILITLFLITFLSACQSTSKHDDKLKNLENEYYHLTLPNKHFLKETKWQIISINDNYLDEYIKLEFNKSYDPSNEFIVKGVLKCDAIMLSASLEPTKKIINFNDDHKSTNLGCLQEEKSFLINLLKSDPKIFRLENDGLILIEKENVIKLKMIK